MSIGTRIATNVFVTLALVADGFVLWVIVAAALAAAGRRRALTRTVEVVGAGARPLALAVAATCTAGSLYYSEIVGFVPCRLCWYQRAAMYPLVLILGLGLWSRARRTTRLVALPFVLLGGGIALYHWLVERVPALAESAACSLRTPCSVPYFTRLGFVTIAWMALSGFLAIGALLLCEGVGDRARTDASPVR